MAPAPITEDYYMVLEVEPTAPLQEIIQSYRRLALKLHPDRNASHNATEVFQLLGRAYETLKDQSKRQHYDLIYPSVSRSRPFPQTTQSETLNEAAQIAALQKSKQERGARWWTKKNTFDFSIFELQRDIQRLEQEIKNLDSIAAAEVAEEAQKNSWGTWLLSPIYMKADDSEEEKARKDRGRQERRIEKDMKERRLSLKYTDLKKQESLFKKAKEEVDALDLADTKKIRVIQDRIWARETLERQERERVESERMAKIWKQQQEQREKREQEAAEALRKQQAEKRAEQEEQAKKWQELINDEGKKEREQYAHRQASISTCRHIGWWPKVQGRTACPECYDIWTYLLQCPGCKMKACPRCQGVIRPRTPRNAARTHRRALP